MTHCTFEGIQCVLVTNTLTLFIENQCNLAWHPWSPLTFRTQKRNGKFFNKKKNALSKVMSVINEKIMSKL